MSYYQVKPVIGLLSLGKDNSFNEVQMTSFRYQNVQSTIDPNAANGQLNG